MKVVFLDIDGVLNCSGSPEELDGFPFVEDEKLLLLKELVDATKAELVLTSTWRYGWDCLQNGRTQDVFDRREIRHFEALQNKLQEYDLKLFDYTADFGRRGKEIEKWLSNWNGEPIESFVILDDLDEDELQPFADRLVKTTFAKGLLPKHIQKAVRLLNEGKDMN